MLARGAQRGPRAVHPRRQHKFFRLSHKGGHWENDPISPWWQMSYSGLLNGGRANLATVAYSRPAFCSGVKHLPRQRAQLLFSGQHGTATQWLTSCAVRGTSSWQLMHAFLISPSRLGWRLLLLQTAAMLFHLAVWTQTGKTLDLSSFVNQKWGI